MEWVEITASSVEEARDSALDQLGVDEQDADIEVLEEPKAGLFGRVRGQARVRARVRPTQPRPKAERRDRKRKKADDDAGAAAPGAGAPADDVAEAPEVVPVGAAPATSEAAGSRSRSGRSAGATRAPRDSSSRPTGGDMAQELTLDQQAEVVAGFLGGLAERFGVSAETSTTAVADDVREIALDGSAQELGLLIGPKGATLQAVQELARTVVQRQGGGTQEGRVRIDVAGYRQRRREALERFTQQVAEKVIASGEATSLEPMHPADRKVVHDTANEIDGVRTVSEGEEPRRRVVLLPDT